MLCFCATATNFISNCFCLPVHSGLGLLCHGSSTGQVFFFSELILPLIFYVGVHYNVALYFKVLMWSVYTNGGLTIWVGTTAILWSIPMEDIHVSWYFFFFVVHKGSAPSCFSANCFELEHTAAGTQESHPISLLPYTVG